MDVLNIDGAPVGIIPIHFDVPTHYIPLDTFIETADQTRNIIGSFNKELFRNSLSFELVILPAEEGSFISRLGVILLAGWGAVWTFTQSDVGKGFIRGLTGHDPGYWTEQLGSTVREYFDDSSISLDQGKLPERIVDVMDTKAIVDVTKSFLQADPENLQYLNLDVPRFREAISARNTFYQACMADAKIQALGFQENHNFPIKRKDFARLQVDIIEATRPPIESRYKVSVETVTVTSPNWDKDDEHRGWKGRNAQGKEKHFRIEDEHFWNLVAERKLDPHIIDTMKIQWAFPIDRRAQLRVLKVIEYNGQILGQALDDNALRSILGALENQSKGDGQIELSL